MDQLEQARPWATVTDSLGTTWLFRIRLDQAIKLRTTRKVNLLQSDFSAVAKQLSDDPVLLAEIAYDIADRQRAELSPPITEEDQFLSRFDGDTWDDFVEASNEAIIDFFPPARREALMKIWRRRRATMDRTIAEAAKVAESEEVLQKIDREGDKALEEFRKRVDAIGAIQS